MSDLTRVIQRNPTVTLTRISLKQAPLGRTRTIRFLNDGEHTLLEVLQVVDIISFHRGDNIFSIRWFILRLLKKERFWEIDEEFLLEIGTCIGELMFAKLKVKTEQA